MASQGQGDRAGTQEASPQPCPQQSLDEGPPVPLHTQQPSLQLPEQAKYASAHQQRKLLSI